MLRYLAVLLCLWAGAAEAQTARKLLLMSGGVPSWVLRAGGVPANIDLNFATGQYYGCTLASCLSITRASSKTNLLPTSASGFAYTTFGNNVLAIDSNGLLIEEARTNQLLNSTVPATQTTGTLAASAQTLWVNGSGSAALSNGTATGCTGTATNGSPVTFTPTAGTCTVTVTGSLNAFQLELGSFGTSLIVTAGATATRAADAVTATGKLATSLKTFPSWHYAAFSVAQNAPISNQYIISSSDGTTNNRIETFESTGSLLIGYRDVTGGVAANPGNSANSLTLAVKNAVARSVSVGSDLAALNGGTVSSSAPASLPGASITISSLGSQFGTQAFLNGYLIRFAVGTGALSSTTVQALSTK